MKNLKIKKIIFYSALAVFLFPTTAKAGLIGDKITKTTYKGMEKISFTSNCTKYTTKTDFPKSNTTKTPGPQLEQNIYYNKDGSGTKNVIWFQHGDGGCGNIAPRKKCETAYFDASQILTHTNNGKNFIMFCPEMNPSGGDACYKHWSINYAEFFPCLYNDFLKAAEKGGLTVSENVIIASHSQGGPATSKITLKQPTNPKIQVVKIIRFDSCYGNQCLDEANIPVEKRGPLITYASTIPVSCPAGKFCNSTANQAATVAKEIYKKPNVESYLVKNADHGAVPTACKTAFLDANHNCAGKATLAGGATTDVAGSGGTAVSSVTVPGGDVLGGIATFDEIQLILQKPKLQVRLPGVNFSDIKEVDEGGTKFLFIPFLGEYLAAGYKYAIVIAGIFATALILNAGFTLLMAAGSSEKVSYAKKRIGEALIGLLLAVGSYVFLYTINPELVNFRNLRVMAIRGYSLGAQEAASLEESGLPVYGKVKGYGPCYGLAINNTKSEQDADMVKCPFLGQDNTGGCNKNVQPIFKRISDQIMADPQWPEFQKIIYYKKQRPWIYNWRCMTSCKDCDKTTCVSASTGKPKRSNHSYGTAVDLAPNQNPACDLDKSTGLFGDDCIPNGGKMVSNMPMWVVDIFEKNNFVWGGRWKTYVDPMHFEWSGNCEPGMTTPSS